MGANGTVERIYYQKGFDYQLVRRYQAETGIFPLVEIKTHWIKLSPLGLLTLELGYAWDGSSGGIDDDTNQRASAEHDAFYKLMRKLLLPESMREATDDRYHEVCRQDGMNEFRAFYFHKAIRALGENAANPRSLKEVFVAPRRKMLTVVNLEKFVDDTNALDELW